MKQDTKFSNENKVIFCRLDWYSYYDGNEPINESNNTERGLQYERFNFKKYNDVHLGYVNVPGSAGINIKKLKPNSDNAFVIFFAQNPNTKKFVIVGFYKNAKCYPKQEKKLSLEDDGIFCFKAEVNDSFLIPIKKRTIDMIGSSRNGIEGSWGYQSWIWYADKLEPEGKTTKWIDSTVQKLLLMKENYDSTKIEEDDAKFQMLINEEPIENIPHKTLTSSREAYTRSPKISKEGIVAANYLCEYNKNHITFISKTSKKQFVEAHHLIPMSKQEIILNKDMQNNGNIDIVENIVSLCPNCHKNIHLGTDNTKLIEKLYEKKIHKLRSKGFDLTLIELNSFYNIK